MRDSQRSKVYKSDAALSKNAKKLPQIGDLRRFTAKVWKSKRVQKAFPKALRDKPPQVKPGFGCRMARGGYWSITIPTWARDEGTVLHEIAHTITLREHRTTVAPHGWEYCDVYLKLALYIMGREAHDALKAAFKENRVRFRPPRKARKFTPEESLALRLRLTRRTVTVSRFSELILD